MLHLIIPPIIIVVALVILVYLFSRRFLEIEKAIQAGALSDEAIHASGAKGWQSLKHLLLGVLEKFAHRLKVGTLKAYNFFHEWTRTLKEKRQVSRPSSSLAKAHQDMLSQPNVHTDMPPTERSQPVALPTEEASFVRASRRARSAEAVKPTPEPKVARPMVSRTVTRPESTESSRRTSSVEKNVEKNQMEAILIERIAANPKDIEAYERLGDYYMEQDNLQDAKECYKQVLRLSPVHRLAKIKVRKLERMLERKAKL